MEYSQLLRNQADYVRELEILLQVATEVVKADENGNSGQRYATMDRLKKRVRQVEAFTSYDLTGIPE